jgi:hypothetical protein
MGVSPSRWIARHIPKGASECNYFTSASQLNNSPVVLKPSLATRPFVKAVAVRRPGVVANPAERFEAAAEAACDGRRQPGVYIIEAAREKIAAPGFVQREQARVAFARRAGVGIGEQVHLAGDTRERCADGAAGVIVNDELRDEDRIGEIGEGAIEALARVDATERVEIGGGICANVHLRLFWARF